MGYIACIEIRWVPRITSYVAIDFSLSQMLGKLICTMVWCLAYKLCCCKWQELISLLFVEERLVSWSMFILLHLELLIRTCILWVQFLKSCHRPAIILIGATLCCLGYWISVSRPERVLLAWLTRKDYC